MNLELRTNGSSTSLTPTIDSLVSKYPASCCLRDLKALGLSGYLYLTKLRLDPLPDKIGAFHRGNNLPVAVK